MKMKIVLIKTILIPVQNVKKGVLPVIQGNIVQVLHVSKAIYLIHKRKIVINVWCLVVNFVLKG